MTTPEERLVKAARKGVSMLADFAQGLLDELEQSTSGQASEKVDLLTDCPDHKPVQHRDGKPPWCRLCGCDAKGTLIGTSAWAAATADAAAQDALGKRAIRPHDHQTQWSYIPCPACGAVVQQDCKGVAVGFVHFERLEEAKKNCPHDTVHRGDQGQEGWNCITCDAPLAPIHAEHATYP